MSRFSPNMEMTSRGAVAGGLGGKARAFGGSVDVAPSPPSGPSVVTCAAPEQTVGWALNSSLFLWSVDGALGV